MNDNAENPQLQGESLDLRDLLDDSQTQELSDYLTISISNDGQNTTVKVTTIDDHPDTYSDVLYGVAATNLQMLLDDSFNSLRDSS
jgi:hypothetical protein